MTIGTSRQTDIIPFESDLRVLYRSGGFKNKLSFEQFFEERKELLLNFDETSDKYSWYFDEYIDLWLNKFPELDANSKKLYKKLSRDLGEHTISLNRRIGEEGLNHLIKTRIISDVEAYADEVDEELLFKLFNTIYNTVIQNDMTCNLRNWNITYDNNQYLRHADRLFITYVDTSDLYDDYSKYYQHLTTKINNGAMNLPHGFKLHKLYLNKCMYLLCLMLLFVCCLQCLCCVSVCVFISFVFCIIFTIFFNTIVCDFYFYSATCC